MFKEETINLFETYFIIKVPKDLVCKFGALNQDLKLILKETSMIKSGFSKFTSPFISANAIKMIYNPCNTFSSGQKVLETFRCSYNVVPSRKRHFWPN